MAEYSMPFTRSQQQIPLLMRHRYPDTAQMMMVLLAGIVVGLVALLPPGPITVSMVGLGARRGSAARSAGFGVASADAMLIIAALVVVALGQELPHWIQTSVRVSSLVFMIAVGIVLICCADRVIGTVDRVERPFRSFWSLSIVSPWVFTGWLALLGAAPFQDETASLAAFACGMVASTWIYHMALGQGASRLSMRISETRLRHATRIGGVSTMAMGVVLAAI